MNEPSKRAKLVKELVILNDPYVILMSGTPTPESFSQMYHQVYVCPQNPFNTYKNFYSFARDYVNIFQKTINSYPVNVYLDGKQSILDEMKPYMISYTQKEAGFKVQTKEEVLKVKMKDVTYDLIKRLKKDLVIEGQKTDEVILADTAVKLMSKIHQLYSGTVKFESGKSQVIDLSKAEFIRTNFKNKKLKEMQKKKQNLKRIKN